jgi:hypothetical protein
MQLRPGMKLRSAVCDGEFVVVRAPSVDVDLGCGGAPLLAGGEAAGGAELDASLGDGTLLGKRYADEASGLELLCTRAGTGSLTIDGAPLTVKAPKPVPSSD